MELKQVLVLRTDLNMRKGKMVAQGAHASMMAVLSNLSHSYVKQWLENSFTKIALGVTTEDQLYELKRIADSSGLITALCVDNGATEFNWVKTATCLAIGPAPVDDINKITGNLKLL